MDTREVDCIRAAIRDAPPAEWPAAKLYWVELFKAALPLGEWEKLGSCRELKARCECNLARTGGTKAMVKSLTAAFENTCALLHRATAAHLEGLALERGWVLSDYTDGQSAYDYAQVFTAKNVYMPYHTYETSSRLMQFAGLEVAMVKYMFTGDVFWSKHDIAGVRTFGRYTLHHTPVVRGEYVYAALNATHSHKYSYKGRFLFHEPAGPGQDLVEVSHGTWPIRAPPEGLSVGPPVGLSVGPPVGPPEGLITKADLARAQRDIDARMVDIHLRIDKLAAQSDLDGLATQSDLDGLATQSDLASTDQTIAELHSAIAEFTASQARRPASGWWPALTVALTVALAAALAVAFRLHADNTVMV